MRILVTSFFGYRAVPWSGTKIRIFQHVQKVVMMRLIHILLVQIVWILLLSFPAIAKKKSSTIVILDASRSMWGQINNVSKIVSARNALSNSFVKYTGRLNLGLVAYGHQNAASCEDVQVIQKLTKLDGSRAVKAISRIKPKGSTPISRSLRVAADQLRNSPAPKNIILLADGLDNCKFDPCTTAQLIKTTDKAIRIHVIAFDRKKQKQLSKLKCIAANTGGSFLSATSEKQLKRSLKLAFDESLASSAAVTGSSFKGENKNVLNLRGLKNLPQTTQSNSSSARIEFDLRKKTKQNNNLTSAQKFNLGLGERAGKDGEASGLVPVALTALLNEGGLPIKANIVWRIFDAKPKKNKYRLLSTHREPHPTAALAPGEYFINAAYGRAHLTKKIEVKLGQPVSEIFVMNAGGLRLASVLANGEPVPNHTVSYTIYSDERDQFGTRQKVISNAKPGLIIRLNAGIYHIVSRYGDANASVSADVTIEPGKLTETTINHTAAKVTLKLVFQRGGEALAGTRWSILTPQGDLVKESVGALPTHILAAGNYVVLARRSGEVYKQAFEVKPEETKQIEVVIQ